MTTMKIEVTFDEEVLGTSANDPDIYSTYIASKGPNAITLEEEVEAIGVDGVFDKGMTVFSRLKDGTPISWDYQWKGFLKDAFGSLKKIPGSKCEKIKAYKKEIDGLIFVFPRKIPFELNGEMSVCQRPLRANTPQGERVALASSESIPEGSKQVFEIKCLLDSDVGAVIEALDYGALRGFGQWRNSGKGRFHYRILEKKQGA